MCARQRGIRHPQRLAVALLAILIAAMSRSATAKNLDVDDTPIVVVRVDNIAAVPTDNLQFAEERAAYVFSRIGVGVRWVTEDVAFREQIIPAFTIVLVNAEGNATLAALIEETLGFADPGVHRAHVLCDRISALIGRLPQGTAVTLGDVMAHELGHLMLPLPGHSADGIMRPGVYMKVRGAETFTKLQGREIVSRLRQER
jgi:hypothetical protein